MREWNWRIIPQMISWLCLHHISETPETQSLPQTREVHIQTIINWILRSNSWPRHSSNEQQESWKGEALATTNKHNRSTRIYRIYRILLILHTRLLVHCQTTTWFDHKDHTLALGKGTTKIIRNITKSNVQQTSVTLTGLYKEILRTLGCIGIWHGSHTLTRGRT